MHRVASVIVVTLVGWASLGTGCRSTPEARTTAETSGDTEAPQRTEVRDPTGEAFARTGDDPRLEWGPCPPYMPESCGIAVLQGDPEEPNADVFFRMAPNTTAPAHWHTSAERMVLVSGEMHVDYDGQEPVVLRPGTYAYGPPGLPHETHCAEGAPCILFIAFEEPVDALAVADEPAPGSEERALARTSADVEWGACPEFFPEGCGIAVLHGDPAAANADVFFRMAPDTVAPEHWHTSAERMVLISGTMTIDYEGQEPLVLEPGTHVHGPAQRSHGVVCAAGEECVLFIAFEEPIDAIPTE
jgi:quercetin dioxygenase-like cupin family protein